jgi:hypothetical protein
MRKAASIVLLLVLGLGSIVLALWLTSTQTAAADVRLSRFAVPALAGPPANRVDLVPRDTMTQTRWISLDGREPTSFAEWQAQRPPSPPLRVERVYTSRRAAAGAPSDQVVCVVVHADLYDGIATALARWIADVEREGWTVIVDRATFPNPPALRNYLAGISDLDGCLLVGDLPVPWYELDDKEFPLDIYYMDLDGTWVDVDLDGMYDDHVGAVGPEIWVGRLQTGNLDFGADEIALLNNYFHKNHAYRTGDLILPSRALVYLDDPWANSAEGMSQTMALLYPDTTVISGSLTTTALDYGRRLTDYYAWIHVFAHSTAFSHIFALPEGEEGPGAIYNLDIYRLDPNAFFYNLFACGSARFVERNYLSGWYVFADTHGLLAIGPTKTGGMVRGFDLFHEPLARGASLGQAFREWFAVKGVEDKGWHYGLVLHGDPTLTVLTEEQVGEAPTGLAIGGPRTGIVGAAVSLTATVDPGTATQPLRYTWQVTGQTPMTRHGGGSDVASFIWWNTPGPKTVTATAINLAGTVTATYALTITAPGIDIAPRSYHETLSLGQVLTRPLILSNTGQGGLTFRLAETDHGPAAGSAPDLFGYTYLDSNGAGGPTYKWIEIAPPAGGSGTQVDLPTVWQGGYAWPISLPFTFPFCGKGYDRLAIGSRGTLSFVDRAIGRENQPLPSVRTFEVETFIAPFWDFLVIDPGAVYYQDLGTMFVVEYYQVSRYGGADGTWEVILYDSGNVLFQYQDVDFGYYWGNRGRSATVGIQGDALMGLQYSYDEAALSDGLAICFAYPGQLPDCSAYRDVSWLSEDPAAGTIEVGGAQTVGLVFDAGASEVTGPGDYTSALIVVSNDPDEPLGTVPVTMTISAPPRAVADLVGTRSGSDLRLSWSPVTSDTLGHAIVPDHYVVYRRAGEPYFDPEAGDVVGTPSTPSYTDAGVLGDPAQAYTYLVTAVDAGGAESALSNRLGVFSLSLAPASTAGERMLNLIALDLKVSGVSDADSLAAYVGSGVYMVVRHDAATQGIEWRLPGLAGTNFPVEVGGAYFLSLDTTAPGVVSLVGNVPARDEIEFVLARPQTGEACTYNFLSVPLHRDDLTQADALAAAVGGVHTVSRHDAETQELVVRVPGGAGSNFPVRAGHPYIVCLEETGPSQWP